jgi:uncharacterized protein (DUF488 family)
MFKRQKILLALIEQFGGELPRTELQKLLFLYCERSGDRAYDFVPYKFGCFSFQTYADKDKLMERGYLTDSKPWKLPHAVDTRYRDQLSYDERQTLWTIHKRYGELSTEELVTQVYRNYPYYAINSQIAGDLLNKEELSVVDRIRPSVEGQALVSIGYEGLSLEVYINHLIRFGVKLVCDVRKNPLSRKFGFSKTALKRSLEHMGIEYRHFPELGIPSDKRQTLNTQRDYDRLFDRYEKEILCNQGDAVAEIADLMNEVSRIALLCYERLPEQCHRTRVANAVLKHLSSKLEPITN